MTADRSPDDIKKAVRDHYAAAITQNTGCCCGPRPQNLDPGAPTYAELAGYSGSETAGLPDGVTTFGCGNPVNFMDVTPGQTILDLGSGAGLDLILASKKVGPSGRVIGLDMTPEMISTCRQNLAAAGITNADVIQGEMEQMPIPDASVDWIMSNCVINLSPDKAKVFTEAFRVLKPGGRMMISDIVTNNLPDEYRGDILAWVGCLAGAPEEAEYLRLVREAGFEDERIIEKSTYDAVSLATLANDPCGCGAADRPIDGSIVEKFAGRVSSAKITARKPS